jgi:hypothetical protein
MVPARQRLLLSTMTTMVSTPLYTAEYQLHESHALSRWGEIPWIFATKLHYQTSKYMKLVRPFRKTTEICTPLHTAHCRSVSTATATCKSRSKSQHSTSQTMTRTLETHTRASAATNATTTPFRQNMVLCADLSFPSQSHRTPIAWGKRQRYHYMPRSRILSFVSPQR